MNRKNRNRDWKTLVIAIAADCLLTGGGFFLLDPRLPDTQAVKYWFTIGVSAITFVLAFWAIYYDAVSLETIGWSVSCLKQAVYLLAVVWGIGGAFIIVQLYWLGHPVNALLGTAPQSIFKHWLFVGPSEELLFRGYMFTRLRQLFSKKGKIWSVLIGMLVSSLIFAVYHIPQRMVVEGISVNSGEMMINLFRVFLIGMVLAWLFFRSGNVIFVGLVHGGLNAPLLRYNTESPLLPATILALSLVIVEVVSRKSHIEKGSEA